MTYNTVFLVKTLEEMIKKLENFDKKTNDYDVLVEKEKKAALWIIDMLKKGIEEY